MTLDRDDFADPQTAREAFRAKLALETDCADVHAARAAIGEGFVLLDVRGPVSYAQAHVPGAISLPHIEIDAARLSAWGDDARFVVYCAGPHCNGADKAAMKIAALGRPVKVMIGGVVGWREEGFPFATGEAPG